MHTNVFISFKIIFIEKLQKSPSAEDFAPRPPPTYPHWEFLATPLP